MAERGLNVVLLARRQAALEEVASSIRAATGVETRAVAVDLAAHDAMAKILDAMSGLDVGMPYTEVFSARVSRSSGP